MTVRSLWIDPSFGASGDMLLGALVGLGADVDQIVERLEGLGVTGWTIDASSTTRCGLSAQRVDVTAGHDHARHWSDIDALIEGSALAPSVSDGARATFRRLGEIEAAAHDVPIESVHFHEVGAVDAIVDIVGVWVALDLLGVDRVTVGPVGLGHGTVRGAHGVLPLPAPATAALLAGAPVRSLDVAMETCTPTGAALLATLGTWGPMPDGVLLATARGAGGRDPQSHPNVVTAHLFEATDGRWERSAPPVDGPDTSAIATVLLSTNLDDVTPEVLGHTIGRLLDAGADDAWVVPIVMKKSRPAFQLCALAGPERAAELRAIISAETGTLGIRSTTVDKFVSPRSFDVVDIDGRPVAIKIGPHGPKAEHDDLVALANETGRPLRDLAAEAVRRWRDNLGR